MAMLTFLWYDILVKKGSLQRNGTTAIPKNKRMWVCVWVCTFALELTKNSSVNFIFVKYWLSFHGSATRAAIYWTTTAANWQLGSWQQLWHTPAAAHRDWLVSLLQSLTAFDSCCCCCCWPPLYGHWPCRGSWASRLWRPLRSLEGVTEVADSFVACHLKCKNDELHYFGLSLDLPI